MKWKRIPHGSILGKSCCLSWFCRIGCCNSVVTNPYDFLCSLVGNNHCVWQSINSYQCHVSIELQRLGTIKGKNGHFSFWTCCTWNLQFLACCIVKVCCTKEKSDHYSITNKNFALLWANCWLMYALTSQQGSNICWCISDKISLFVDSHESLVVIPNWPNPFSSNS